MEISFRPHHFMCAFCYQGEGYSPAFVANFDAIMAILNAPGGDNQSIELTHQTDSICSPCPHRTGATCHSQPKIEQLDAAHAEALALHQLKSLTWGEAKQRIAEKLTIDIFDKICEGCDWKASGLCETVLRKTNIISTRQI